ncbi:MAG: hypothetical protein ABR978_05610 [Dehalococcoidia bacterium]
MNLAQLDVLFSGARRTSLLARDYDPRMAFAFGDDRSTSLLTWDCDPPVEVAFGDGRSTPPLAWDYDALVEVAFGDGRSIPPLAWDYVAPVAITGRGTLFFFELLSRTERIDTLAAAPRAAPSGPADADKGGTALLVHAMG